MSRSIEFHYTAPASAIETAFITNEGSLGLIAIDPTSQGSGRELKVTVLDWALQHGLSSVRVGAAGVDLSRTQRVYGTCGFPPERAAIVLSPPVHRCERIAGMTACTIPFNKPCLTGNELRYVADAIQAGHSAGDGQFTRDCHRLLEQELGVPKVLLTTSCTHALEMAALLLNIEPGDEVIVPSFTFVSTVNAFVLRGARPVFADVRPDTLNLDETQLERLVTPRTRAIVPVHYAGVGCEMDAILEIASRHHLIVIEDNAHGLFGRYKGRNLGTFGALAAQSFHETKNVICGEGGALVVNDPQYIARAEILREKGTNRSRFFRGEVDKYTWVDAGSSYLPSDILAAFLLAQLECRGQIQAKRRRIWECYYQRLRDWAAEHAVGMPCVPASCEQSYHMFYLLLPSLEVRQAVIQHLKHRGILSVFHYLPLHLSDMGRGFGGRAGDCPVTEHVSDRLLRLPFYNDLSENEQASVIEALTRYAFPAGKVQAV